MGMDARRWVCGLAILLGACGARAGDLTLDWDPPGGGFRMDFGGPLAGREFTSRRAPPAGDARLQFSLDNGIQRIDRDLGTFGFYPVVSVGVGYRF
jgi:hypothetical protein